MCRQVNWRSQKYEEELVIPEQRKSELRRNGSTRFLKRSAEDLAKRAEENLAVTSSILKQEGQEVRMSNGIFGPHAASVISKKAPKE